MPSILVRYLSRLFIVRFLFVLAGITALGELLELFANADEIMEEERHAVVALARYGLLRLPELLTIMAAPSAGLGALLAFATLVRNHELVSFRAAGVSQFRLVLALIPAAVLVLLFEWTVQDQMVPPAVRALRELGVGEYGGGESDGSMRWVRQGSSVVSWNFARGAELGGVRIFERNEAGRLIAEIRADSAMYRNGRWTLHKVSRLSVASNALTDLPDQEWPIAYTPARFKFVSAHPSELSFRQLRHLASDPQFGNRPNYFYQTWLSEKIAAPLGTLLLALLAVPLTQHFQRQTAIIGMLAVGIALSFLYLIFRGVMTSFGESGVVPPFMAAWGPVLILLAVGASLFVRHEQY